LKSMAQTLSPDNPQVLVYKLLIRIRVGHLQR
jgi:hypothetical protein